MSLRHLSVLLLAGLVLAMTACGGGDRAAAAGDDLARVTQAGVLRVGVKADTPPFGFKRGDTLAGFDIDIAHALAQQMGLKDVVFVPVTSANRLAKLQAGEVDCVIASMTITRTRAREVDFTIPYFQDGQALLVKGDSPVRSYLDLSGRKVGAVKGSTSASNMKQVAPDAVVVAFDSFAALLAGLEAGTVDAITSDQLILQALAQGAKTAGLRIAGDRFSTEPYGIAVRQNQSRLRGALDEALQGIWEKGRWQLIFDTWFGPRAKFHTSSTFAITPYPR